MKKNRLKATFLALFILALFIGGVYIKYTWDSNVKQTSEQALTIAKGAGIALNGTNLKMLTASPEDVSTSAYLTVKNRLLELKSLNKKVKFVYLYVQKEGKLYFVADSEHVNSPDYSPPGQEYTEADNEYIKAIVKDEAFVTKPVNDRWGTWFSTLVPLHDAETGEVMSVFAMDYPVESWYQDATYHTVLASVIVVIFILFLLTFFRSLEVTTQAKEIEERFRSFSQSVQDAVVVMDAHGCVEMWNKTAETMFGYSEHEMLGKEFHKFITTKKEHEDNTNIKKFGHTGESDVLNKLIELPVKNKKGEEFIVELSVSRALINGEWNAIGIMRDISDRKHTDELLKKSAQEVGLKAQELQEQKKAILNILEDVELGKERSDQLASDLKKFKLAVENANDHVVITDPNGMILFANKSVERITGFSADEIIGKKAGSKELWGGLMTPEFYTNLWKTIKIDKKPLLGEVKNKRKNGVEYIAKASISPVLNEKNEVDYFVGIERDITKEVQVDKMKTEFISLASHQLRTPLSAMRWFTEMLLNGDMGKMTPEQVEAIQNIDSSNKRMITLVNSLLNISRIESGRIIVDPRPTDVHLIIQDVVKELEQKYNEKKQKIILTVHPGLPLISLDEKLIHEVYVNLLTNAIKYSPENTEIIISISKKDDNLISQVSDNGYGIPTAQHDKIFQKFFRADNVAKRETDGTGLGLYLVKSIIESSQGKIWFKSEENKGTSFWFTLPLSGMKEKKGEVSLN